MFHVNSDMLIHTEVKFRCYNSSSSFNIYLWNEALVFGQLFHMHHATVGCHNLAKFQIPCTKSHDLRSNFHMGKSVAISTALSP